VLEVHDASAAAELSLYEELDLCAEGEGGRLIDEGVTEIGGRLPVNTSGGLLAKGHPVGATGVAQIYEIFLQLRGEAGDRQVAGARVGMTENGGMVRAAPRLPSTSSPYRHRPNIPAGRAVPVGPQPSARRCVGPTYRRSLSPPVGRPSVLRVRVGGTFRFRRPGERLRAPRRQKLVGTFRFRWRCQQVSPSGARSGEATW
jgi:hypothetical protein